MYTQVQENQQATRPSIVLKRLQNVRQGLKRGDKKKIADSLGVHWVWVSMVIAGKGVSERVLSAAEELIRERENQNN